MTERSYPSFLIYLDVDGQFRWRLDSAKGEIAAYSGKGFHHLIDCEHAIDLIHRAPHYATWETQEVTDKRRKWRV